MKKFFVWLIIILFLLGSYGVYLILIFSKQNTTPTTTVTTSVELSDKILIFHSKNCPVCKELKKYVENYKIAEQLHNIQWLEVDAGKEDEYNVSLYISKIQECNLGSDSYVVPLTYYNGKCYIGSDQITILINDLISASSSTTIGTTTTSSTVIPVNK